MTFDRRTILASGAATLAASALAGPLAGCASLRPSFDGAARLRSLESESGGALGAAVLDTGSAAIFGNRLDERFAHCSSFKLSLAALAMQRAANGGDSLDLALPVASDDIVSYSPVTKERVGQTMTIGELAKTSLTISDNAAANILLRRLGGPEAMTAFWRSIGDDVSRLDRYETELNFVPPGELRDTTTPRAMAQTVHALLYGYALPGKMRQTLREWMVETSTGMNRIRGGIPGGWTAGDKTGTAFADGMGSIYVDLAYAEPPTGAPLIITGYLRLVEVHTRAERDSAAVLAALGAIAATSAQQV